jgi:hypothetical protein
MVNGFKFVQFHDFCILEFFQDTQILVAGKQIGKSLCVLRAFVRKNSNFAQRHKGHEENVPSG